MRPLPSSIANPVRIFTRLTAAAVLLVACKDSPSSSNARECGGEPRRLAVGEALDVRADAKCDLGREAGAEYALAYFDARVVQGSRTAPEPYHSTATYVVTVEDLISGAVQQVAPRAAGVDRAALAAGARDWTVAPAGAPGQYRGASGGEDGWTVGEAVTVSSDCQVSPCHTRSARVVRVYDGGMVVAAVESEVAGELPGMLELLDQAAPVVAQHALPLLKSVYTDGAPAASAVGGSQIFILLEADHTRSSGHAYARPSLGGDPLTFISIEPLTGFNVPRTVSLVSHELAHAYQFTHMMRTRSQGIHAAGMGVARWGVEGGANLLSYETIRRAAGMPLAGNHDFRNPGATPFQRYHAVRAQHGDGELTGGYEAANGFLRDLVIRRVQAGEAVDDAVREVSRGAVEGWFGIDVYGSRRQGLTQRMQARISGWEPVEAALTWTLSHAGDDRTNNPLYQDRAWLQIWRLAEDGYGWAPHAVLQGGQSGYAAVRAYGSPGYFYLHDTGAGVSFRVTATVENVRWRVLRVK